MGVASISVQYSRSCVYSEEKRKKKMPRRSTRSRSRGRPERYGEAAVSEEKPKAVKARWPGSSLFFKAKVTMVRDEEDEYDVECENGTVYTIRAKDVYKATSKIMKKAGTRRSKSRGRSVPREKKPKAVEVAPEDEFSDDEQAAAKTEDEADTPVEEPKEVEPVVEAVVEAIVEPVVEPVVVKAPKVKAVKEIKAETPTRTSARIAAKAISDAFSDDEGEKIRLAPNPELPDARGKKKGWSFEWVWALIFMILGPVILVSLH